MGEYRVMVSINVVNSDGDPVDYRGHVKLKDRPHSPLAAAIEFSGNDDINRALADLNGVFNVVNSVKALASGSN